MTDTDDTSHPVDMNALLRNRDRASNQAAWHSRLFGITDTETTETTETSSGADDGTTDDGGDTAA
jgi:hypothetical protein